MRVSGGNTILARAAAAIEFVPAEPLQPVDWQELFARSAPIEVDLGCGDGAVLVALAEQYPERNFLGVERLIGRVRSACRKAVHRRLTNVRLLRMDIAYAVEHLLPAGSVDAFHLLFPDPWPKRRHQHRRVLTNELLHGIARALKPAGTLHLATDQADYFRQMLRLAGESEVFEEIGFDAAGESFPTTSFERRFREAGEEIHRVVFRKTSEPR
jgi:tRNA (guanine-N7-)-methyltransferase